MSFSHLSKLNNVNSLNRWRKHIICILSTWIALFPAFAFALPEDPTVQHGTVAFDTTVEKTLTVTQTTPKAIIDWREFNIQADEATHFKMLSTDDVILNRVTGGIGSEIFGTLTSNGNLMLINPNGILFGAKSKIDVGGLIATTSNITDDNFKVGNFQFDIPSSVNRTVINRGVINVSQGGLLAFVAPGVENSGIINAQLGQVSLASGKTFTLDLYGDKLVSLGVDSKILNQVIGPDGQPVSSLVKNGGKIFANGGTVFLEVNAARDVVDHVINMDGLIEAKSAVQENGEIILLGGDEGLVNVTGKLDASGKEAGQTGGEVQVLGEWVGLLENAFIDVSGDLGGGTALIGGDYKGEGLVPTSEKTYFHSTAFVTADALSSGNGGKVILWADDATYFYGSISGLGGLQGGNGGFVETSGKKFLDFDGNVDVSAANGDAGTLLLDPLSITLLATTPGSPPDGFNTSTDLAELFGDDSGESSIFDPRASGTFSGVAAGTTIILQATDFITVDADFNLQTATGNTGVSLIMQAGNNININQSITLDNGGTLHIEADSLHTALGGNGTGTITLNTGKSLTTSNGTVTLSALNFAIDGSISTGNANVIIGQSVDGAALTLGYVGAMLTDAELDNITTTGTIIIGQATTAGLNGAGGGTQLTTGAITVDELTQGTKNITLISNNTINDQGDTGNAITTTGDLVLTTTLASGAAIGGANAQGLNIDIGGTVSISSTGTGAVTITEADGLAFGTTGISGSLTATATAGNITQTSGALTVGLTSLFNADTTGTNIILDGASNAFTGAVTIQSNGGAGTFGTITFVDSDTVNINSAASAAGDLFLDVAGGAILNITATTNDITQATAVTTTGASSFTTLGTDADIDLSTTTNSFGGSVTLSTTGTTANATVDGGNGALDIAASTVNGDLTLTSDNVAGITDSGTVTVMGNLVATTAGGNNGVVDMGDLAVTGTFDITTDGNGDATLVNATGIQFIASEIGGELSATATTGNISQTATALVISGAGNSTLVTSADDATIILNSATNSFGGAFLITTNDSAGTDADVTLNGGVGGLDIGLSTIDGDLTVTSAVLAGIVDSGIATVGGDLSASTTALNGVVTLNQLAVSGTFAITTDGNGDATLVNATGIQFVASSIGGELSATATAGNITQTSGALTVGLTSLFNADTTGTNIILDGASNAFTGAVTIQSNGGAGTFGTITFVDSDTVNINSAASAAGDLFLDVAGGAILNITATTNDITQAAAVTTTGASSFTTLGTDADIDLSTTTNSFGGAVSLSTTGATGNATIDNGSTVLDFGTVTVGGNLDAQSDDSIKDTGIITVTGTARFATDSTADKTIFLGSQNAITGAVTLLTSGTGGDVIFDNGSTALALGTVTVGGDLTLDTDSTSTQTFSSSITNNGALTINVGGALTMTDGTIFNAGSGTISVTSTGDITLGQLTTTNSTSAAISLTSNGGNILDGGDSQEDITATTGTVGVNTGGGTFGTTANEIEITSATLSVSGLAVEPATADGTLEGTSETVGEASVDQTINIVENLVTAVESGNQIQVGSGVSTVAVNIDPPQPGPGPVIVDVYSESYKLVDTKEMGPDISADMGQLDNFWLGEEEDN